MSIWLLTTFAAKDNEDGCHLLVRGHLVDSRTSVTDVKFAPKYLGLQLVCIFVSEEYAHFKIV